MEKISVIVAVYNVEQYIEKAIDSILSQTYKYLEIILVDDGSTDNSGKICDEYAKKDSRIVVVHQENGGVAEAYNKGLETSTGDYIGFVDPDDYIEKEMFEDLYSIAQREKVDIVNCGFYSHIGVKVYELNNYGIEPNVRVDREQIREFLSEYKVKGVNLVVTKLIKRNIITDYNIRVVPKLNIQEDTIFCLQIMLKAESMYFTDKSYYHYIIRENSLTTKKYRKDIYKHYNKAFLLIKQIYDEEGIKGYEHELLVRFAHYALVILKREKYHKIPFFKRNKVLKDIGETELFQSIISNEEEIKKSEIKNYYIFNLLFFLIKNKLYSLLSLVILIFIH